MELPHDKWAFLGLLAILLYLAVQNTIARRHAKRTRQQLDHEMNPNSGNSMRDKVNLLIALVGELKDRVEVLERAAEKRGRSSMWRRR